MDVRGELREFLTPRRNRLTAAQPGSLRPAGGGCPGCAGTKSRSPPESATSGTRGAHLLDLVRALGPASPRKQRTTTITVRPGLQSLPDPMTDTAAILTNERADILATNELGRACYADICRQPNHARLIFLDPAARAFHRGDTAANKAVALLRAAAGRSPSSRELTDLVGELSTRSEEFRTLWASHNVHRHTTGLERSPPLRRRPGPALHGSTHRQLTPGPSRGHTGAG